MKKLSILVLTLLVTMFACKKTPEVNLKYVDVEHELITVGTTTATVQCDYKYIATLKKAYLYYGEGENAVDMNAAEMRVVQNTLYVDLAGLKSNTTYSYYYEFHNGFNSMRTALKTFKTEAGNGGGEEPPTPPEIMLPTVITAMVTEITTNSAQCGGEVTNDGGAEVTERGICWGTNENPTLNDSHVTAGMGLGAFTAMMNGLEANTAYHVRAYAVNESGTAYGLDREFLTLAGGGTIELPTVITREVSMVTSHSAQCSGEVTNDGGAEVIERGICWSTNANPTISGSHVSAGNGTGMFSAMMSGLQAAATYHVRAYAINEAGTAYGFDKEFITLNGGGSGAPEGSIDGLFSVSSTQKVYFSQGNLQYIGSATIPYWKFAENQWDYLGATTGQWNSNDPNVDRDFFGWGTSGWSNGNVYYQPYDCDHLDDWNASDFGYGYGPTDGTSYRFNLTGAYCNADWGYYNAISNGGNTPNQWRTLIDDEWIYVFHKRSTPSGIRYAKGIVNGVNGVILLPDDWSTSVYVLNYPNRGDAPYTINDISVENWVAMELAGAVFLAADGNYGSYWSASYYDNGRGYRVSFSSNSLSSPSSHNSNYTAERYSKHSVRLVRDAE